jgi:protocatechuate 4,5-dioxygenase alpha chain
MKQLEPNSEPNARRPGSGVAENALNRLCQSLASGDNARRFKAFPEAYCHGFGLTREETHAITDLDIPRLLLLGARIERLALLTALFNLDVLELGAQQSGLTVEQFAAQHSALGRRPH